MVFFSFVDGGDDFLGGCLWWGLFVLWCWLLFCFVVWVLCFVLFVCLFINEIAIRLGFKRCAVP